MRPVGTLHCGHCKVHKGWRGVPQTPAGRTPDSPEAEAARMEWRCVAAD